MATLTTDRLILRPIVKNDLNDIYSHATNPNIGPSAGWKPHESKRETKEIMKALFLDQDTIWAITIKGNDTLMGIVGLEDDPKRNNPDARMLGYWLNEEDWGKGIMTEAAREVVRHGFEDLNIPIITSNCFDFNEASRTIIEKLGMKFEGILRQGEKRFDNKVFDLRMYSLTKDEYENNK